MISGVSTFIAVSFSMLVGVYSPTPTSIRPPQELGSIGPEAVPPTDNPQEPPASTEPKTTPEADAPEEQPSSETPGAPPPQPTEPAPPEGPLEPPPPQPLLPEANTNAEQLAAKAAAAPAPAQEETQKEEEEEEEEEEEWETVRRPRHRFVHSHLGAARYNQLGLAHDFLFGYRLQLIDSPKRLLKDTYFAVKGEIFVNPSYEALGPVIELQPLAIFRIQAKYLFTGFLRTFGNLQSFPSSLSDHSDDTLDALEDDNTNYNTWGHSFIITPRLQLPLGKRLAIRDSAAFYWLDYNLRSGDTVFYDQQLDILLPDRGWAVLNDLDLLYLFQKFRLRIGVRYTLTHAFYRYPDHFAEGEPDVRPNGPTHRVGPAFIYTFYEKKGLEYFNRPTMFLLLQWWIQHRYRAGQEVNQAIPMVTIGMLFDGDLLPRVGKRRKTKKTAKRSTASSN